MHIPDGVPEVTEAKGVILDDVGRCLNANKVALAGGVGGPLNAVCINTVTRVQSGE